MAISTDALLARGDSVVIVDDLNSYYDVQQKRDNLTFLTDKYGADRIRLAVGDICAALPRYAYL